MDKFLFNGITFVSLLLILNKLAGGCIYKKGHKLYVLVIGVIPISIYPSAPASCRVKCLRWHTHYGIYIIFPYFPVNLA